jgi:hypothetical protein
MFNHCLVFVLLPCLLLASCAPRVSPPVMSAELAAAFEKGPLCQRLNGVMWPCSDTDGRLWKEWYAQRQEADHAAAMQAIRTTGLQVLGTALLLGAVGGLAYGAHRSSSAYRYDHSMTTRCYYGVYSSTCTTRY